MKKITSIQIVTLMFFALIMLSNCASSRMTVCEKLAKQDEKDGIVQKTFTSQIYNIVVASDIPMDSVYLGPSQEIVIPTQATSSDLTTRDGVLTSTSSSLNQDWIICESERGKHNNRFKEFAYDSVVIDIDTTIMVPKTIEQKFYNPVTGQHEFKYITKHVPKVVKAQRKVPVIVELETLVIEYYSAENEKSVFCVCRREIRENDKLETAKYFFEGYSYEAYTTGAEMIYFPGTTYDNVYVLYATQGSSEVKKTTEYLQNPDNVRKSR